MQTDPPFSQLANKAFKTELPSAGNTLLRILGRKVDIQLSTLVPQSKAKDGDQEDAWQGSLLCSLSFPVQHPTDSWESQNTDKEK